MYVSMDQPRTGSSPILPILAVCLIVYVLYAGFVVKSNSPQADSPAVQSNEGQSLELDDLLSTAGPCDKYKSQSQCNNDASCVWCVSYAIPSACYNVKDAKQLPHPVFVCDKPGEQEELQTLSEPSEVGQEVNFQERFAALMNDADLAFKVTEASADPLCDKVKQISGYIRLRSSRKNYFFWFFESRSDPAKDPVVLWLTGGPGCSSELALFAENGPCTIDGSSTKSNKFSWNTKANLLYVDQPSGTGFSYGEERSTHNEKDVSQDMYIFVTMFLQKFEKYRNLPFFLFGESYAGHYVPASAHRMWMGNQRNESPVKINLKGVSVGNGMTNPLLQFPAYPEMAYNNSYRRLVSETVYNDMKKAVPTCTALINLCNLVGGYACDSARDFCSQALIFPIQLAGWNVYDVRIKCQKPPLCYDFSKIGAFLNRADVREKLGVPSTVRRWEECSNSVNRRFHKDWIHSFDQELPDLLHANIPVLIYNGDTDFICNWMGEKRWVLALQWKRTGEFQQAKDVAWNNNAGLIRSVGPFSFLQVFNAGHMVPMDQPKVALDMLNQFLKGGSMIKNDQDMVRDE